MKLKFSRKKILFIISLMIFCLINISVNFNHISHHIKKNTHNNESEYFSYQEFKIYEADMNDNSKKYGINIVFDASHHQFFSIWDTGFAGYSDLAILLMNNSFRVSASTRFLNETIPALNNNDILVLNYGKYQTYTDQEVDLIDQFVYQGGGLLVFGDHENVCEINTFQNKLLERFNMSINDDKIEDNIYYYKHDYYIRFNSSYFNLTNITFFSSASMKLNSGATPIAITMSSSTPKNAIVGARCEYGNGRVISVTDGEFLWNGDARTGLTFNMGLKIGNNSNFILKIIEWLANKSFASNTIQILPQYGLFTADSFLLNLTTNGIYNITTDIQGGIITPEQLINAGTWSMWNITVNNDGYVNFLVNNSTQIKNCTVYFFKPTNPIKTILISEVNFSRNVDQSISGLYNFAKYLKDHNFSVFASEFELNASNFDAVCISNPLQNISSSQISNLLHSDKILVLGESYFTFLGWGPLANYFLGLGFKPRWNPLNELLMNYRINIAHYLICDNITNENDDLIYPIIEGIIPDLKFSSYQSSVVNISSNLTIFGQGSKYSWGENVSCLGFAPPLSFDDQDLTSTPLIVYNSSIIAIGDTDVITNERGDAFLFPFLECWLKTGKPYVNFTLTPSKENISADRKSKVTITSGILHDSNGNEVKNGTLITISTDLGTIITPDEDVFTPGIQVSIQNKILNFSIQARKVPGIAHIYAYNFSLAVLSNTTVRFLYKAPKLLEIVSISTIVQDNLVKSFNVVILIILFGIVSICAALIILLMEKKLIEKKITIQPKKVLEKIKAIEEKKIEKPKKTKVKKFERRKL